MVFQLVWPVAEGTKGSITSTLPSRRAVLESTEPEKTLRAIVLVSSLATSFVFVIVLAEVVKMLALSL